MEVTVGLGRKTDADLLVFARAKIVRDDIANKIRRSFGVSRHYNERSYRRRDRSTTVGQRCDDFLSLIPCFSAVVRSIMAQNRFSGLPCAVKTAEAVSER